MQYSLTYQGNLRVLCRHESGVEILTDAPKDNQGKGEAFSPTDLLAVSLGSCMLTLMGIAARKWKVDLTGMTATVEKEMAPDAPRRIGCVRVHIHVPMPVDPSIREKLEAAARGCPVHHSLHPSLKQEIEWIWGA